MQVAGFVAGIVFTFSCDSLQSTIEYHEHQSVRVKDLGRYQLNFSVFSEIHRFCLEQWVLTISLCRANNSLGNSLSCLGVSMGSL